MLFSSRSSPRSAVTIEPRVFMDESQRNKVGKSTGAFLNGAKQEHMPHPIGGLFDVPIHHGGGGGNAPFVRGGDDLHPTRCSQLVRTQLLSHTIVPNFRGGAG